ncbi:CUE domain-containing protein [Podospora appendiculata]|uniref:Coupling of ubiquitin conjugation to ER degradation protein 1 n=1 Tax=Podospora appendiculata TaxID=314037 RepID=A0AAE0XAD4_9PEZI|nr:CUE domain-containing protein [Podospora appendiculata]
MANPTDEQVNVPSLVVILVISGLIIRYLFFSAPAPPSPAAQARQQRDASRAREAAVERIQQMFPQVERRTALWNLQRNGGNIAATTERILAGRTETPPITFQPPPPPDATPSAQQQQQRQQQQQQQNQEAKPADKPPQPDLITRYNLKDKVGAAAAEEEVPASGSSGAAAGQGRAKGWSQNKDERQSLLQKRRDQMILDARRKMEAKIAAEKAAKEGGA